MCVENKRSINLGNFDVLIVDGGDKARGPSFGEGPEGPRYGD